MKFLCISENDVVNYNNQHHLMALPRNPHYRTPPHERLGKAFRLLYRSMATVLFLMFCMYLNVLSKDGIEGITQWPGATVRSDFSPQGRDLHLMSPSSSEIDGDAPNLNELEYRPALRRFRTDTVTTIKDKEKDRLDGAAPPSRRE